jgi:hypothetical protein
MKMPKRKSSPSLSVQECFGAVNTYRIFALQSELSAFPFANILGKIDNTTFTILPDFEYITNKFTAFFSVFYAEYSREDAINCLLLENKTSHFNQDELFISKSEKKRSFQTMSLFEEHLYLFNNHGLRFFEVDFTDIDYILLFYSKKEIDNNIFKQFLTHLSHYKACDISYLLERMQTSVEEKIVFFLREFYGKYEVKASQFSRKREMNLLAPVKQIPKQNLQFPIPIMLEHDSIANHLRLSEEYLAFLKDEY